MAKRHSWAKVKLHCYVCRKCATCFENRQDRVGGWFRTWSLPDGSRLHSFTTPPCEPGRTTEKRLQHYAAAIAAARSGAMADGGA